MKVFVVEVATVLSVFVLSASALSLPPGPAKVTKRWNHKSACGRAARPS